MIFEKLANNTNGYSTESDTFSNNSSLIIKSSFLFLQKLSSLFAITFCLCALETITKLSFNFFHNLLFYQFLP